MQNKEQYNFSGTKDEFRGKEWEHKNVDCCTHKQIQDLPPWKH